MRPFGSNSSDTFIVAELPFSSTNANSSFIQSASAVGFAFRPSLPKPIDIGVVMPENWVVAGERNDAHVRAQASAAHGAMDKAVKRRLERRLERREIADRERGVDVGVDRIELNGTSEPRRPPALKHRIRNLAAACCTQRRHHKERMQSSGGRRWIGILRVVGVIPVRQRKIGISRRLAQYPLKEIEIHPVPRQKVPLDRVLTAVPAGFPNLFREV